MTETDLTTLFTKTRAQNNLSDRQLKVLQASLTLFAKVGYDRASTTDIAQLAGVSEGTVFSQFKTKEQLLRAILTPFIDQVLPLAADEFLEQLQMENLPHFVDFITFITHDRMSFVMKNRGEFKIFVQEMGRNPELLQMLTQRLNTLINSRLSELLMAYQDKGELVKWAPMRISRYITSVLLGYLLPNVLMSDEPLDIEAQTQEVVEFLLRGLHA